MWNQSKCPPFQCCKGRKKEYWFIIANFHNHKSGSKNGWDWMGPLKVISSNPLRSSRATYIPGPCPGAFPTSPRMETPQPGHRKKSFLVLRRNLLAPSPLHIPFTYLHTWIDSTLTHLHSQAEQFQLSAFPQRREIFQSLHPHLWKAQHPFLFKFPSGLHGTGWRTNLFTGMKP